MRRGVRLNSAMQQGHTLEHADRFSVPGQPFINGHKLKWFGQTLRDEQPVKRVFVIVEQRQCGHADQVPVGDVQPFEAVLPDAIRERRNLQSQFPER